MLQFARRCFCRVYTVPTRRDKSDPSRAHSLDPIGGRYAGGWREGMGTLSLHTLRRDGCRAGYSIYIRTSLGWRDHHGWLSGGHFCHIRKHATCAHRRHAHPPPPRKPRTHPNPLAPAPAPRAGLVLRCLGNRNANRCTELAGANPSRVCCCTVRVISRVPHGGTKKDPLVCGLETLHRN